MLIMEKERMTQQEFATALEISPSSLSSIFNGRTNPTNNHVQAIHRRFPQINVNWLMFGEGDMYSEVPTAEKANSAPAVDSAMLPFEDASPHMTMGNGVGELAPGTSTLGVLSGMPGDLFGGDVPLHAATPIIRETIKYVDKPQRKITEIRIFFDDGTFETFQGSR